MGRPRLLAALCAGVLVLAACAGTGAGQAGEAAVLPPAPPPGVPPPPPPGYALPDGHWVYTEQYGWIWMTTAEQYFYVPPGGAGEPLEFVYYAPAGWTWVAAPWVWGYGPRPYWGRARPERFAWYRHGHWRSPERWRYTGPPPRAGLARGGVRPPPPHPSRGEGRRAASPGASRGDRERPPAGGEASPAPPPRAQGREGTAPAPRGGRGGRGGGEERGDGGARR